MNFRPLAALALVLAVAGCSSGTPAAKPTAAPKTFTAIGALDLGGQPDGGDRAPCEGANGYTDIHAGTQVVVYDATGKSLGVSALASGSTISNGPTSFATCHFKFSVPSLPSGVGPYSVQVGDHEKTAFTEADAGAVKVSINNDNN